MSQADIKVYSETSRSTQFATKERFRHDVLDLFQKYKVDTAQDQLDFVKSMENDLNFLRKRKRQTQQDSIIEDQLQILSLPQRNDLVTLLTHKPADGDDKCLNEDILELFPSLRQKSEHLLRQGARKTREDKIDLGFVDEFMHDHCR